MGNFNRGGGFGGKKRFDNDRGGGFRGDRGDRAERPTMHQATCAECGEKCSVPFKPTGSKPVFCSNCFGKKEGGSNGNRFDRRDSNRSSFGDKQMFKAICDKCQEECEVPFKPTGDKPVFCSNCFSKTDRGSERGNDGRGKSSSDQYQKQFEMLNNKLDTLIKILSPKTVIDKVMKTPSAKAPEVKEDKSVKKVIKPTSVKASVGKKVVIKKTIKKVATKKKK